MRGRNLFNAKERIGPKFYDADQRLIQAKVSSFSGNVYETTVALHSNGTPMACSCSCNSFGMFKGACKHVIGLLFSSLNCEFSEDGESPEMADPKHPLAGRPRLLRPLLTFDELMAISAGEEKKSTKRRGRPPKPVETETEAKAKVGEPNTNKISTYLRDQTVVKEETFVPIRPGYRTLDKDLGTAEINQRIVPQATGKELMDKLFSWTVREDNHLRRADGYQKQEDKLIIEALVELEFGLQSEFGNLSLRMGTEEYLYVVQSIPQFLEAYQNGESLYFGTYFTWKESQRLSAIQQAFVDWLVLASIESGSPSRMMESHDERYMPLHYEMLKQFLFINQENYPELRIELKVNGVQFPYVFRRRMPRNFTLYIKPSEVQENSAGLAKPEDAFTLSLRDGEHEVQIAQSKSNKSRYLTDSSLVILHRDGLAFYDYVLYFFEQKQERFIWNVLQTLAQAKDSQVRLNAAQMSYFLALAKEYLDEKQRVLIESSLREKLQEEELEVRTYIDYLADRVSLSSFYFYGEHYFRPLYREQLPRKNAVIQPEVLLVRDIRREKEFVQLLDFLNFEVLNLKSEHMGMLSEGAEGQYMANQFYLEDDAAIFSFLKNGLKQIQSLSTLFVSPSFRQFELLEAGETEILLDYQDQGEWIDIEIQMDGFTPEEAAKIVYAYSHNQVFARLDDFRFVDLEASLKKHDWVKKIGNLVRTLASWGAKWHEQKYRISRYRSLALQNLLDAEGISVSARDSKLLETWQRLKADALEPERYAPQVPDDIQAVLRSYQVEGFQWLSYLDRYGFGGILADEMGLGKTLQILSFLWSKYKQNSSEQYLVIAPTSLIYNWEQEVKRFVPNLPVYVIEGVKGQRQEALKALENKSGLIIVSYGLARQDKRELSAFHFAYLIIDEAQNIKNPTTKTSRAVKSLKAKGRFALTGTPIENHIGELWSIFDFIMPGYLFNYSVFQERFGQVGTWTLPSADVDGQEYLWSETEREVRNQQKSLNQLVSPFVLRRMKVDVLADLPDKIVTDLPVHMTPEQQALYRLHLARARRQLVDYDQADAQVQSRKRMDILGELTRLRQICCDPRLFVQGYTGGSGKLDALEDLLGNLLEGKHRILLFSQFTSMLHLIQDMLENKGISSFYIDGQVSAKKRLELVDRFNAGEQEIFLISLKAGGTGLNLTGADVVIHFDPWWNPAVENQATDRAHRIGQRHVVQVYRMVTKGSIEEKIQELQERKQALLDDIVSPGVKSLHTMQIDDLKALFA